MPKTSGFAFLLVAAIALAALAGACAPSQGISPQPTTAPSPTVGASADWVAVFFTKPNTTQARTLRGGVDAQVANAIDGAKQSVDAALYDLNLWSIRDALIRAHRRGVQVRIVAESAHLNRPEFKALRAAGIPIVGDNRRPLMHDKFFVIDRYEVWTGSMNYTLSGVYRNNNNEVRLRSARVAADYEAEFEEMFSRRLFGEYSPANTPYPNIVLNGHPLGVFFAPEDHALSHLLTAVRHAKQSIYFLAFSFTDDELAYLLISKAKEGVDVRGVMDKDQFHSNRNTQYLRLKRAGLPVYLDANPYAMHHKVFIIDGEVVEFGSYNFTYSAEERNDENMVLLDDAAAARQFTDEFWRIYKAAHRQSGQ